MPIPFPFEVAVAGVSWHQDLVCTLEPGDVVEVVAEPENAFDANALLVRAKGSKLGYIPRVLASRLVAQGVRSLRGEVVSRGGKVVEGVRVRLEPGPESVADSPTGSEDRAAQTVDGDHVQLVTVRTTGRVLGTFVGHDRGAGLVLVDSRGARVEYADDLVVIEAPIPCV